MLAGMIAQFLAEFQYQSLIVLATGLRAQRDIGGFLAGVRAKCIKRPAG